APVEQAIEQNIPESQTLKLAEETPPFSKERFKAGFGTVAGLGMAAAGARGLSETLFPKPGETAGVTEISPVASEDMRPVPEEAFVQPTKPEEVIPSASEITSSERAVSGEVRPSVDEEASLRQSEPVAEIRPEAEIPQEV